MCSQWMGLYHVWNRDENSTIHEWNTKKYILVTMREDHEKKKLKKVKESLKKCGKKNKRTRQDGGGKGKIWYQHGKEDFIA